MDFAEKSGKLVASPSSQAERRTGVLFMSLILATNFVPWMQLAERATESTNPPSSGESAVVIASCFLAAGVVIAAWLLGRRLPSDLGPRVARPRDAGLVLAVMVAGLNLLLAAVIHWRTTRGSLSFHDDLKWFGAVWYLLVLPAQASAGFCKGRASIPAQKYAPPARSQQSG